MLAHPAAWHAPCGAIRGEAVVSDAVAAIPARARRAAVSAVPAARLTSQPDAPCCGGVRSSGCTGSECKTLVIAAENDFTPLEEKRATGRAPRRRFRRGARFASWNTVRRGPRDQRELAGAAHRSGRCRPPSVGPVTRPSQLDELSLTGSIAEEHADRDRRQPCCTGPPRRPSV